MSLPAHSRGAALRVCPARGSITGLVWLNQYGNSRQLRFIEKWSPGERLTVGIVKMSILQKLAYASEVFTKE